MDPWIHGSVDPWIHGSRNPWIHGSIDPWIHGSMDAWIHGSKDPRIHGSKSSPKSSKQMSRRALKAKEGPRPSQRPPEGNFGVPKKHKVATKLISHERYGEILFPKVASGYLLHFVQDGSSKNALDKCVCAKCKKTNTLFINL